MACCALVVALPLVTSCSTLRSGVPVEAAFSPEDDAEEIGSSRPADEAGWASRNIPGWKALKAVVPPPTDARKKWDRWQNRRRAVPDDGLGF